MTWWVWLLIGWAAIATVAVVVLIAAFIYYGGKLIDTIEKLWR